ncbi:hypothetical protein RAN3_1147 [plant metagenome]|uniref:Uncharacterized protein n=1 Tax=plant metagenome TaxID=1297885 RepID=A0A484V183_9ZZZZ
MADIHSPLTDHPGSFGNRFRNEPRAAIVKREVHRHGAVITVVVIDPCIEKEYGCKRPVLRISSPARIRVFEQQVETALFRYDVLRAIAWPVCLVRREGCQRFHHFRIIIASAKEAQKCLNLHGDFSYCSTAMSVSTMPCGRARMRRRLHVDRCPAGSCAASVLSTFEAFHRIEIDGERILKTVLCAACFQQVRDGPLVLVNVSDAELAGGIIIKKMKCFRGLVGVDPVAYNLVRLVEVVNLLGRKHGPAARRRDLVTVAPQIFDHIHEAKRTEQRLVIGLGPVLVQGVQVEYRHVELSLQAAQGAVRPIERDKIAGKRDGRAKVFDDGIRDRAAESTETAIYFGEFLKRLRLALRLDQIPIIFQALLHLQGIILFDEIVKAAGNIVVHGESWIPKKKQDAEGSQHS